MGVSIQHRCVIRFTNESDCEKFYEYLERWIEKGHFIRNSGTDVNKYSYKNNISNSPEWYFCELFEHENDIEDNYMEYKYGDSDNTIEIDTGGYGNIPDFVIGCALEYFKAESFYLRQYGCQGQENTNIILHHNKLLSNTDCIFIPDYVDAFDNY